MATINDREYDWSSIEVRTDGGPPLVKITAISYEWTVERALVEGAGRKPLGMTKGRLKPGNGSITFHRSEYDALASTAGWCDVVRTIVVQYTDDVLGTSTETVKGVRFGGGKGGGENGTDPLSVEVPFMFTDILINGVSPIDDTSVTKQVQ
jgi:hypothetical protein